MNIPFIDGVVQDCRPLPHPILPPLEPDQHHFDQLSIELQHKIFYEGVLIKNLVHESLSGPQIILKYSAKEVINLLKKWTPAGLVRVLLSFFIRRIIQGPFNPLVSCKISHHSQMKI